MLYAPEVVVIVKYWFVSIAAYWKTFLFVERKNNLMEDYIEELLETPDEVCWDEDSTDIEDAVEM